MTLFGDEVFEMHGLPFDPVTAEAILAGKVSADDAPSGYKAVATLILAAKPQVLAQGAAVEDQVVAAFAAELRTPSSVPTGASHGRSRVLGKVLTAKAAVALAVVAFGGVAAAAATGSLPSPVQSAAASGLAHVGISIPHPNSHASANALLGAANSKAGNSKAGNSKSGTGHGALPTASLYGQCTAYSASAQATSTGRGTSSAHNHFQLLLAAASAKGETVSQLCAGVKPPSGSSVSPGSSSSGSKGSGSNTSGSKTSGSKTSGSGHEPSTTGPPAGVRPVSASASTSHPSGSSHRPSGSARPAPGPSARVASSTERPTRG